MILSRLINFYSPRNHQKNIGFKLSKNKNNHTKNKKKILQVIKSVEVHCFRMQRLQTVPNCQIPVQKLNQDKCQYDELAFSYLPIHQNEKNVILLKQHEHIKYSARIQNTPIK